jgi:hypothetical protein
LVAAELDLAEPPPDAEAELPEPTIEIAPEPEVVVVYEPLAA